MAGPQRSLSQGDATGASVGLAKLPLTFEPATPGTYLARSGPFQVHFTSTGFQMLPISADGSFSLRARFASANPNPEILTLEKTGGESNYLVGANSSAWRTHVPQFRKLRYQDVYPGIDLVFYGNNGRLEHDFIVQPGSDYHAIQIQYDGQRSMRLTRRGDLEIATGSGVLTVHAPHIYQERNGQPIVRVGRFVMHQDEVSFAVQDYDHSLPLVIDPVLEYATYLADQDLHVNGVATDATGNTYIVGLTFYSSYPVTSGALQTTCAACASDKPDVFITKLNATGTAQIYSTFLGGSDYNEGEGIAVDANGNAVVVGRTTSPDFPLKNAVNAGSPGIYNGFVASIAPDGASLNFSSVLGGGSPSSNTYIAAVATDASGNVYVSGITDSPLIPQTAGALNAGTPSYSNDYFFLTKFSPAGSLSYGAIPGASGSASECCSVAGIRVDAQGDAFIGGTVGSNPVSATTPWPTTPGAYQSQPLTAGSASAFAAEISPDGRKFLYSTLAGTGVVTGMALDASQEVILAGTSPAGISPTSDAFDTLPSQSFVTKLSSDGTKLLYYSYFGVSEQGQSLGDVYLTTAAVDGTGNVWLAGNDVSGTNVPQVHPVQSLPGSFGAPTGTAFISEFDPAMHNLLFSTYFNGNQGGSRAGGITIDSQGRAHFVGTGMDDLPTTPSAFLGSVTSAPQGYTYNFGFAALIDPAAAGPGICFSGDTHPVATLGSSMPGTIKVTNCGTAPLIITNIEVSGPGFSLPAPASCAVTIASAQSCSLSLDFSPSVANNSSGSLTLSSNAPVSQTVLPITGVGIVGTGPAVALSSLSADFGSVQVGSTSSEKQLYVTNAGNEPLTFASIATTGDFQQTNNCNSPVLGNEGCSINLTFAPTTGGTRTGTLTITSNAAGSPQTVALTGVGVTALTLAPSSPTLTVGSSGQSTTADIQLSSQTGFTGTVSLSCAVKFMGQGTPNDLPTCSLNPSQVQISSSGTVSSTLTITTTAGSASMIQRASLGMMAIVLLGFMPRRRMFTALCVLLVACSTAAILSGCGGGSTKSPSGAPPVVDAGTTTGLYDVVITATSGNVTSSATLSLNVQ